MPKVQRCPRAVGDVAGGETRTPGRGTRWRRVGVPDGRVGGCRHPPSVGPEMSGWLSMAQYAVLIYDDEPAIWSDEQRKEVMDAYYADSDLSPAAARATAAEGLAPDEHRYHHPRAGRADADHRRTVRREQGGSGGFYLITGDDIDEALHGAPERRPAPSSCGPSSTSPRRPAAEQGRPSRRRAYRVRSPRPARTR